MYHDHCYAKVKPREIDYHAAKNTMKYLRQKVAKYRRGYNTRGNVNSFTNFLKHTRIKCGYNSRSVQK